MFFSFLLYILSFLPIRTGNITITSDFGEARPLRFHMGIDFSTHGKVGLPVYALDDGVIVRLKRSYFGYGNAIYLMTKDSIIYVYSHLKKFIKPLEDTVFSVQIHTKRYRQDIFFKKHYFHVKKGEVIGYSGESGVGYPHLHFEKRIGWLMPVFPLSERIPLKPSLEGIIMETPSGNYRIKGIKGHRVYLPFEKRFKLFFLVRHTKAILVLYKNDTLFEFSIDTLNYLRNRESALLYKPQKNHLRGYVRTNFYGNLPELVKRAQREYNLEKEGKMKLLLVSFYNDTTEYLLVFSKKIKRNHAFCKTFDGIYYSFSDYNINISEKAKKIGYKFIHFKQDSLFILGNKKIYAQINTKYFPYLKGLFYRTSGDSLFIYPEFPQLTGYIYVKSYDSTKEVYRITPFGKRYVKKTLKLGAFVLERDTIKPYVRFIGGKKSIAFYVDDDLSGVEPDSMSLYLNNRWYPVYYDFERKIAKIYHPLKRGTYLVKFEVTDRAHNKKVFKRRVCIR